MRRTVGGDVDGRGDDGAVRLGSGEGAALLSVVVANPSPPITGCARHNNNHSLTSITLS